MDCQGLRVITIHTIILLTYEWCNISYKTIPNSILLSSEQYRIYTIHNYTEILEELYEELYDNT